MKKRVKVNFIEFIRPDGYWPAPYSIDQAFGVMRWMVATGNAMTKSKGDAGQWGTSTVINLLTCSPTCVHSFAPKSIIDIDALQQSFRYALLSKHESRQVKRWKETFGIGHSLTKILTFPNEGGWGNGVSAQRVDQLLKCKRGLTTQLNEYHPAATELHGVTVNIDANGSVNAYYPPGGQFRFTLDYGYDGSEWHHDIAIGTPEETFSQTLKRAEIELDKLTGADKWPLAETITQNLTVDQKRACTAAIYHDGFTYTVEWGRWRDDPGIGNRWYITKAEPSQTGE